MPTTQTPHMIKKIVVNVKVSYLLRLGLGHMIWPV